MTYSVKGRAVSFGALLAVGGALLASYAFLLGILPERPHDTISGKLYV